VGAAGWGRAKSWLLQRGTPSHGRHTRHAATSQ
jgi:hypothetical protein